MQTGNRFYVAGPMRDIPYFNFPAFADATRKLRERGHEVFSPAERDLERYGNITNAAGNEAQAVIEHGFDLRMALGDDLAWICSHATGLVLLPDWEKSKGAFAEYSTAVALGLDIYTLTEALAL